MRLQSVDVGGLETCDAGVHASIKADPIRWVAETTNKRPWDVGCGHTIEIAECVHCGIATLSRPAT